MAIKREVTRADFVKQADGSVAICVEVMEIAPDPFNKGAVIRQPAQPSPMTPQMAQERYGLGVTDIVVEINEALLADHAAMRADRDAMKLELTAATKEAERLAKEVVRLGGAPPS